MSSELFTCLLGIAVALAIAVAVSRSGYDPSRSIEPPPFGAIDDVLEEKENG